jgi:ATP-binding cassette subfamily B protein
MAQEKNRTTTKTKEAAKEPSLFGLLGGYKGVLAILLFVTLSANALNLFLPQITAQAIDAYIKGDFILATVVREFFMVAFFMLLFMAFQSIAQTYASERVARNMRTRLAAKISRESYASVMGSDPAKLLTNLTSDIDAVKNFVGQAFISLISSFFLIVASAVLLVRLDWRLALAVLAIVPLIGMTFFVVLRRVRKLFLKSREVIDWLNKVINESILGAALIRVIHAEKPEEKKFLAANANAKDLGMSILRMFAFMIPIITFITNLATLVILALGSRFVIEGSMSLGAFAAFNSYLAILIFPIFVIGFMSNIIAQADASYGRVRAILEAPDPVPDGVFKGVLDGAIEIKDLTVSYGERDILKKVSFSVRPGTRTAVIGPTAAGKTQLLYALTGLIKPRAGDILYDGRPIGDYDPENLHEQIGLVFQDSIIFNMSLRENIAFNTSVSDVAMAKATLTAELNDFVDGLPNGLSTVVSERGTSLSGGQKQRIMLARALAVEPKILLLDDFTSRVDTQTERKILANVKKNYPGITLISVTQKIAPIEDYDQIIVLMEGEVLAAGTHAELMGRSPEYVQIFNSQKSTNQYER